MVDGEWSNRRIVKFGFVICGTIRLPPSTIHESFRHFHAKSFRRFLGQRHVEHAGDLLHAEGIVYGTIDGDFEGGHFGMMK